MRKQSGRSWFVQAAGFAWLVVVVLLIAGYQPVRLPTEAAGPWPMNLEPVVRSATGEAVEQELESKQESGTGPNRLRPKAEEGETLAEGARFETGKEDDPLERARWFWQQRIYPTGQLQFRAYQNALDTELSTAWVAAADAPHWIELGPKPLKDITFGGQTSHDASGRALSVALAPNNANIVLVGAAQGGIWRSTDGGATFSAVADNMPSLAIKVIRFAPSNPSIVYAGTGEPHGSTSIYGQGVLKSTNGGQSWQLLPNNGAAWDFRGVSVSGLQVDPTDPDTLYVTTAAVRVPIDYFNPADVPVTGIFKSVDGGQTWQLLKETTQYTTPYSYLDQNHGFMDLEMFRGNPEVLYATELFGGIYRTTDSGANWELMTPRKNTLAPVGDPDMGATFPAPVADWTYFDANNGKFTLTRVALNSDNRPDFDRIELTLAQSGGAIDPQDPGTYVLYAGYSTSDVGLNLPNLGGADGAGLVFKSTDGGATWTWLSDWGRGGAPNYCATQCSYDNTVEVNPQDPDDVVLGGSANYNSTWPVPTDHISNPPIQRYQALPWRGQVYRSLDGGQSWIDITPGCLTLTENVGTWSGKPLDSCAEPAGDRVIHPDIHGLTFAPNNRILAATDGGLFRATVSGSGTLPSNYVWQNLNQGLATLQFYDFGLHPTNSLIILGGMQDNANGYWNGQSWEGWGFGDGTLGLFDPKAPQHVYMGTQFYVHRHDNGGAKVALDPAGNAANGWRLGIWGSGSVQAGDRAPFIPVFAINSVTPTVVFGASRTGLYVSENRGDDWVGRLNNNPLFGEPTAIAVSSVNPKLVYVSTSFGAVYLFDFDTPGIFDRSAGLPGRYITRVAASAVQSNTLYVTFSGYDQNTPDTPGKIFKSTNRGQTWTNISGNLPDVPVSALAVDPTNEDRVWVGSDVGVFVTLDGGQSWQSYRLNMPVVAIMDMEYNPVTKLLVVSTHGRGVWQFADYVSELYLPLIRK